MPTPMVECNQNPRICGHLFAAPPLTSYGIPLTTEQAEKGFGTLECEYGAPGSICPAVQALLAKASAVPQPVQTP